MLGFFEFSLIPHVSSSFSNKVLSKEFFSNAPIGQDNKYNITKLLKAMSHLIINILMSLNWKPLVSLITIS